jgi:MFS family permease
MIVSTQQWSFLWQPGVADRELTSRHRVLRLSYLSLVLALLLANYFVAQYDKFILSYFQVELIDDLGLSSSAYGLLSGFATGIVYALLAIPLAYLADVTSRRVWVLTACSLWWNVCVILQGEAKTFWQIFLARIGMGIGQSAVEALSISLISDFLRKDWVLVGDRQAAPDRAASRG